jgi:NAD(P)-dependent dehydrogenase (short-subunit alcohol dehydrogenase family)
VSERFLVTGALGCLGAWTVYLLVAESTDVVTYDVSEDDRRLRLLLSDREVESLRSVRGDITDPDHLRAVVETERTPTSSTSPPFRCLSAEPIRCGELKSTWWGRSTSSRRFDPWATRSRA